MKLLPIIFAVCFFSLLGGCQNISLPAKETVETDDSAPFDEAEVVEAADDTFYTNEYLLPKIYQSPLKIEDDVWQRVRDGFQLDYNYADQRTDNELAWYQKNPAYLDRVNVRASRYIWHITEEIQKRNMPMEIALLPIVESAYDPFAYSHARASGTWQFIPSTAKFMGLKRDWWYDGRRDILSSTNAALDLLQRLHDRLDNDWLLALAAYNSGEGNVRKAIAYNKKRNKPTDFWHLRLPKETKAYVPKLLALARLYQDPEKYHTYILPIHNEPYFEIANTGSQIDLAQAANLAEVDIEEIYLLNPGFNRWATSPNGPNQLLLPKENIALFRSALKKLPESERVHWEQYTVKNGDTLSVIATAFNVSTDTLASVNRIHNNHINTGESLMIPVASGSNYSLSQDQRSEKVQRMLEDIDSPKTIHTVKSGESLWTISKKYKTTSKKIARWNGMAERDPLRVGKKLIIWKKGEPQIPSATLANQAALNIQIPDSLPPATTDRKIYYRVRSGDSLGKIADHFSTTVSKISQWNKIGAKKIIHPGQSIIIFTDIADAH